MAKKDMVKKKSKKNLLDQKVLGTDVKTLGTVIASAVIAEIAKANVKKASSSMTQSLQEDDRTDQVRSSTKDFANAVKAAVEEASPPVRKAIETAAESLSNFNPAIAAVVDAVKGIPDATTGATEDTVDTTVETTKGITTDTKHSIEDTAEDSVNKFKNVAGDAKRSLINTVDAAKVALLDVKPEQKKSKKSKKNKKKNKKK